MGRIALASLLCASLCIGCSSIVPALNDSPRVSAQDASRTQLNATTKATIAGDGTTRIFSCPTGHLVYVPLPPIATWGYTEVAVGANNAVSTKSTAWPAGAAAVHKLLTNISTNITQTSDEFSGVVTGIGTGSRRNRNYVIDFMKWRAEPLTDSNGQALGWARVGVGLRLVVVVTSGDVDLSGSLLSLAAGAKSGRVSGSISVELIGLDDSQIAQAVPFNVDLSESNIQKIAEALAIVKAKMYDASTTVSPSAIARMQCGAETSK